MVPPFLLGDDVRGRLRIEDPMARDLATRRDLLDILNAGLARLGDCGECRFSTISRLSSPDREGCNWIPGYLSCADFFPYACRGPGRDVVARTRRRYNML